MLDKLLTAGLCYFGVKLALEHVAPKLPEAVPAPEVVAGVAGAFAGLYAAKFIK